MALSEIQKIRSSVNELGDMIFRSSILSWSFKREIFTIASLAVGCSQCQAHGAFSLQEAGMPEERIQALWNFEDSAIFSESEKIAYRFVLAACQFPPTHTTSMIDDLRECYSEIEVDMILYVCSIAALRNRYNEMAGSKLSKQHLEWALLKLLPLGWTPKADPE